MRRGITTYRDDLDLQNLIDFVQKKSILNTMCGYGMQSLNAWSIEDKIHLNGCLKKIGTWGRQNLLIIGGITTGLCLLEAGLNNTCSAQLQYTCNRSLGGLTTTTNYFQNCRIQAPSGWCSSRTGP
ncbi:UNVERIFIED_CONTAM: hypothetical protein FKN15_073817 [Acipenser sinensis]